MNPLYLQWFNRESGGGNWDNPCGHQYGLGGPEGLAIVAQYTLHHERGQEHGKGSNPSGYKCHVTRIVVSASPSLGWPLVREDGVWRRYCPQAPLWVLDRGNPGPVDERGMVVRDLDWLSGAGITLHGVDQAVSALIEALTPEQRAALVVRRSE